MIAVLQYASPSNMRDALNFLHCHDIDFKEVAEF